MDLERAVTMEQIKLTFPVEGRRCYQIETSTDGSHWTLAADETQIPVTEKIRTEVLAKHPGAHLLRVTFNTMPAALGEVEISGRLTAH